MREELIRIENGIKTIDGYDFLAGIWLQIYRSEICGIISAEQKEMEQLLAVLQGSQRLDHGTVYINEKKAEEDEYPVILRSNIRMIDGHSHMIKALTLAENMFIITDKQKKMFVQKSENEQNLEMLFEQFSIGFDVNTPVIKLSRLQQFKFEILKAYIQEIRLVLVDLHRNDLSAQEIEELFLLINKMKKQNITFIVWNPVLNQLIRYSDYMVILKNGKTGRVLLHDEFNENKITHILLGDIQQRSSTKMTTIKHAVFQMGNVSDFYLHNVNLSIKAGEVSFIHCETPEGLAHFQKILFGQSVSDSGYMVVGDKLYMPKGIEDAIEKGVGIIEESTFSNTLFFNMSVFDNICMVKGSHLKSIWWKKNYRQSLKKKINSWFDRDICDERLQMLSENELQKVLFCRWMLYRPKILVLVNPFIGGCINMNEASMENIRRIASLGTGVIILSNNEIPFPALCDHKKILTTCGELKEKTRYYEKTRD